MKVSTIQTLLDMNFVTLEECPESEKNTCVNVVKKTEDGKFYKVKETENEIAMDVLADMASDIKTIKHIVVFCFSAVIIIPIILYIISSFSH